MHDARRPAVCARVLTRGVTAVLLYALLACCSGKVDDLAGSEWNWKNDREYVATWSVQDVPVLEVGLSYHGKEPDLPFTGPEPPHDWRSRDTDFYSCVLRNLTGQPMRLRSVRLELDKGKPGKEGPHGTAYLVERWGSDIIPPGGVLSRRNTWVWGKGNENTLTKTYQVEIVSGGGRTGDPALAPPAQGPGEEPVTFSFQTPLPYKR